MSSLESRRYKDDMIEVYKIVLDKYDPVVTKSLFSLNTTNTRFKVEQTKFQHYLLQKFIY